MAIDSQSGFPNEVKVPSYPMTREGKCPFSPAVEGQRIMAETSVSRVHTASGDTPWIVTRHADIRKVAIDSTFSADPRGERFPDGGRAVGGMQASFLQMDDPEHKRLRGMIAKRFTGRRAEELRPRVQEIVDDVLDTMIDGKASADLVADYALPVPSLVICGLLGVPYTDHEFFQRRSNVILQAKLSNDDRFAALYDLAAYLGTLLQSKIQHPADDVLSDLGEAVAAGSLSPEAAAEMAMLLLIAGHETTASMISLGTLTLLENPDQLNALDLDSRSPSMALAVDELLRYLSIVQNGPWRVATRDIEVGGSLIEAGDGIILGVEFGNYDPRVFPQPEALKLARDDDQHLTFGYGPHGCLGQALARVELQVAYGSLFRRLPNLRYEGDLADVDFRFEASVYGVNRLPVAW